MDHIVESSVKQNLKPLVGLCKKLEQTGRGGSGIEHFSDLGGDELHNCERNCVAIYFL